MEHIYFIYYCLLLFLQIKSMSFEIVNHYIQIIWYMINKKYIQAHWKIHVYQ